ncbi:hypothetical protein CR513_30446, partial [Mucuna pruriens]
MKVHLGEFQEGDPVLKKILSTQNRGKWTPNYEGPYMVKKAFSGGAMILTNMDGKDLPHLVNFDLLTKPPQANWGQHELDANLKADVDSHLETDPYRYRKTDFTSARFKHRPSFSSSELRVEFELNRVARGDWLGIWHTLEGTTSHLLLTVVVGSWSPSFPLNPLLCIAAQGSIMKSFTLPGATNVTSSTNVATDLWEDS